MPMKVKSSSSTALRGICSVTFDAADWSCEPHAAESSSRSASPEAVEDATEHQREPKQRQIEGETQTRFVGEEDVCIEQERPSPDVADKTHLMGENDDDDEADHVKEDETQTEADQNTQEIPCGSDLHVVEEKVENTLLAQQQTTKESETKPDDPSGRPGSVVSSSEPVAAAMGVETSETMHNEGAAELEDRDADDDVGVRAEKSEEADEQVELKYEAVDSTKEATEEDNPEHSRSSEPDVDSSTTLSKHRGFTRRKRDKRVQKRESRSLRDLKVLQASIVTQLK
ncbi:uncharacterized protein LOC120793199 [Xiphias gladius]|uniref:uncharacterized protein LOC120793199 n=1 Tax=Xiphias gladius TaxID=8245 RepID=UPI001A98E3D8|nr:uncharacterized protein LOC120793199 [Xiphias gladius]